MFRYRLKELIAEKALREGRKITLGDVNNATGVGEAVLSKIGSPSRPGVTNTRYLEAICRFLDCSTDELLVFVPARGETESCHVDDLYPEQQG